MKNFDINRFVLVFKRRISLAKGKIASKIIVATGVLLFINVILMANIGDRDFIRGFNDGYNEEAKSEVAQEPAEQKENISAREIFGTTICITYILTLCGVFIIASAVAFDNKSTKADRINEVMLPATPIEKFVSDQVLYWLFPFILCIPAILAAELGRMIITEYFSIPLFEQYKGIIVVEGLKELKDIGYWSDFIISNRYNIPVIIRNLWNIAFIISCQSVAVFVCNYSRKYNEAKAAVAVIIYIICFFAIITETASQDYAVLQYSSVGIATIIITLVFWRLTYHYSKNTLAIESKVLG